jgi:hypothetical protein
MEWNIENLKLKHNRDGGDSRKTKIIDAIATTPAAMVAGGAAGSMGGSLVADTLNFGPIESANKSTTKMVTKAIQHHKLKTKVFTGRDAVQEAIKDKQPGTKGYATSSFDQKVFDPKKAKNFKDVNSLYRAALKSTKVVVPSGGAKHVILHELGHIKQFHSPGRMVTNATLSKVVKPGGAAAAVALMSHEDTAKYAPIVAPIAMSAGELSMEGGASIFAAKEMARQKGTKAGLNTALKLVKPFATYLAKPVGVGVGLYGLKNYLYGSKKKNGK